MTTQVSACPSCGTKARIPGDRGQLKVTCPKCSTRWFHPPVVEFVNVAFRCASDGGHFKITMKRTNSAQAFSIHRVWKADGTGRALKPHSAVSAIAGMPTKETLDPFKNYGAHEFSWDGFYCPCCGFVDNSSHSFIRCSSCKDLVCGCRVADAGDGTRTFRCHPICGSSGTITGRIESYTGDHSVSRPGAVPKSLPTATDNAQVPHSPDRRRLT